MLFKTYTDIDPQRTQKGLKSLMKDGMASHSMAILTSGAFLVAFAIHLGASNFVVGLLASIGPLAQILQLPSIFLVEKIRNRKAIVLVSAGIARLTWILIILSAFFLPRPAGLTVLLLSLVITSCLGAVTSCAWNSWMRDFVPEKIMGSFFSRRLKYAIGIGIVLSAAAGFALDKWKQYLPEKELYSYPILFAIGLVFGLIGLFYISRIPEPQMERADKPHGIFKTLLGPFKDENFRKLIAFLCSWNFAVNLAGPFFMVFMIKKLGMSLTFVIGLSILSQISNFFFLTIWGNFTDKFTNKSVLMVCGPLFIFSILAWTFTSLGEAYFLTIPLLVTIHIVMGISSAGIAIASGNISLKLAPKGEATTFLAANTITNSIAAGIAPIIGGLSVDYFADKTISLNIKYLSGTFEKVLTPWVIQQWEFFFVFAFIIGIYSMHRLSMVKEQGEVKENIVIKELYTEVRSQVRVLSSVEFAKQAVTFPLGVLKGLVKGKNNENEG